MYYLTKLSPKYLIFILFSFLVILLTYFFKDIRFDDPYITFRYAKNLSEGHGFVFNEGERILGTTTPLYTLILACCGLFFKNLPLVSIILSSISLIFLSYFLYLILNIVNKKIWGVFCAILIIFNSQTYSCFGLETIFYTMLIYGAILFYLKDYFYLSTILLVIAILTRSDAIILIGLILLAYILKNKKFPYKYVSLFLVIVIPWYLFSFFYFGTFFPSSMSVKTGMSKSIMYVFLMLFEDKVVRFLNPIFGVIKPYYFMFLPLGLLQILNSRKKELIIIPIWTFLHILGYSILRVSPAGCDWHFYPIFPGLIITSFLGVVFCIERVIVIFSSYKVAKGILFSFLIFICCFSIFNSMRYLYEFHNFFPKDENFGTRYNVYRMFGIWASKNTEENSTIACADIGIIGYYSKRKIVDLAGLVTPEMIHHHDDYIWGIKKFKPNLIIYRKQNWKDPPEIIYTNFPYYLIKTFNEDRKGNVLIFKRKD
ncbi:MAG: hypothetical protein A2043_09000 [Candidatus Schekmanbacteria bacterium GWA2_38_9]|uniref:Glycosyltransferase RgtA/B/C/D-like domain-containing protein n=1 Tax=Candidatus Schekmanbacteria bacterium RIFCSPLOWO2_12_FULL_38_15 TaxID=1817883 RepID=A0A1F7SMZ4_9BACT|nr:MAG: hypothetical protein A2043_09000 [Candidatus Schekmanbacteria bacterium GWA2_38_9]OGL47938.1 MAG: hypothetical protein A3H37_07875 [Candidatus Schekmanbacteria bacterium RIFCSPLOWO2_02_FULL_38_14]OGL54577.1 MAG: hypothetical protein A3G31_10515 [Candidatus Schekmanbacteria bacterium RIFCSPLOWO2_12_FULL_38_15]